MLSLSPLWPSFGSQDKNKPTFHSASKGTCILQHHCIDNSTHLTIRIFNTPSPLVTGLPYSLRSFNMALTRDGYAHQEMVELMLDETAALGPTQINTDPLLGIDSGSNIWNLTTEALDSTTLE